MRQVNIFIVQRPIGNRNSITKLYEEFGTNIPYFSLLDGGDYNGLQYLCCADRSIDYEAICDKYKYKYYPAYKFEVEESKFNNKFQILPLYGVKNTPYILREYDGLNQDIPE